MDQISFLNAIQLNILCIFWIIFLHKGGSAEYLGTTGVKGCCDKVFVDINIIIKLFIGISIGLTLAKPQLYLLRALVPSSSCRW